MTAGGILAALADLGVRVETAGTDLRLRGPVREIPEHILAVRASKPEILDLLRRDRFEADELDLLGFNGEPAPDGRLLVRNTAEEPEGLSLFRAEPAPPRGRCRDCSAELPADRWQGRCLNCFNNAERLARVRGAVRDS